MHYRFGHSPFGVIPDLTRKPIGTTLRPPLWLLLQPHHQVLPPPPTLDLLQWIDGRFAPGTAFCETFPGGVHFDRAEPRTTRPYVIVDILTELPLYCTEGLYGESAAVQFTIVCDSIPEGRRLTKVLTRHPIEGLDYVEYSDLGGIDDAVVTAQRTGGVIVLDPNPNPRGGEAVMATVDYLFLLARSD